MSSDISATPFDFRTPGSLADQVESRLATWQQTLCETSAERWNQHLPRRCEWTSSHTQTGRSKEVLTRLPDTGVGVRISMDSGEQSLFVCSRQMLLALVQNVLGNDSDEMPDDRPLTMLELSMVELMMQELALAIGEAIPGSEPLSCEFGGWEQAPRRTRLYLASESLVVCPFEMQIGENKHECSWLIRQVYLRNIFGAVGDLAVEDEPVTQQTLEQLALLIPFSLVIRLGKAQLKLSELADLQPGDVILLDQPISDPLDVCVADDVHFTGRAGRTGSRRAFQIETVAFD